MHETRWSAQLLPCFLLCICSIFTTASAQTAAERPAYSRVNSFSVTAAYANDSSRMLLGTAQNRKLLNIGAAYSRRLFVNNVVNWQYDAEFFPVALESDPVVHEHDVAYSPYPSDIYLTYRTVAACRPSHQSWDVTVGGQTFSGSVTSTCSRTWTTGEAFSPIGMRWNFRPHQKLQPFLGGHGGEMYTSRPIPVDQAGSFNFTFDFDAGLELYRTRTHSVRVEYRYHHISNHNTANQNPGIDNGMVQFSYVFGH